MSNMHDKRIWTPSRAVIANRERGSGSIVYVAPDSLLAQQMGDVSDRLDDLGLDDAPAGISVWEGGFAGGEKDEWNGDYNDVYPVGTFRAPTDDEWAAIRDGRNPFVERCRVIRERTSGPGKGTHCGADSVEELHGVKVCQTHSDEIRRVNRMPTLAELEAEESTHAG